MRKAAFLDRDGVLNYDYGYVADMERYDIIPGAIEAMKKLHHMNYLLVIVTNQSGIARGLYSEYQFKALMQYVIELLSSYDISIAYYFCPHLPKEIERNPCQCRKPMPGMLLQAAYELHIDLRSSIMIGDRLSDIQAAAAAGVPRRFLVGESSYSVQDARNIVTSRFDSLMDCVNKIQL